MSSLTPVATKIVDYSPFLSRVSKRREPSAIRALAPLLKIPGMISLGGGNPNPNYFPFKELDVKLKDGSAFNLSGEDLDTALTYTPSYGVPRLVEWLKNYQIEQHKPPYAQRDDWHICVTSGSADGNSKAFDMLIDEGDPVLIENPTYSGTLAGVKALGCKLVAVSTDQFGLVPGHLAEILNNWPKDSAKPRILYIIPTGQNPSGSTLSVSRRHEVYQIASQHNILILEDDPYFHLRLNDSPPPPSFLSLDVDGRVLRFDSFSKTMSSGLRLGWVTGPQPLVERLQLHQQVSCLHASGIAQMMLLKLLETWGKEGLEAHLNNIRNGYRQRRDSFAKLAEKHLSGLAEWHVPEAGMFFWFKLNGVTSTESLIRERALKQKVLLVPGVAFSSLDGEPSPFVRASFSTASEEEMDEALRRLAALLREDA